MGTRSTRTNALKHLAATIKQAKKNPGELKRPLVKKVAALKRAGVSEDWIERLTSELIELPTRSLLSFVQRNILQDADLINPTDGTKK
jgi:hypothetical protein